MSAALHVPTFRVPEVSQADIEEFHATHFSDDALGLFEAEFLRPDSAQVQNSDTDYGYQDYEDVDDYEDDGLGYYPDGVKRTLTDEQIAIFRHSEMEALRRAEAKASSKSAQVDGAEPAVNQPDKEDGKTPAPSDAMDEAGEGSEEGEIDTEKPVLTKADIRRQKRQRARQKKRENHKFQPEKKPDLRKRTWDVVEAGVDSLYYDDVEQPAGHGAASATQRKQIFYDD